MNIQEKKRQLCIKIVEENRNMNFNILYIHPFFLPTVPETCLHLTYYDD